MLTITKPPVPGSYWVLPGKFLAGWYPGYWAGSLSNCHMQEVYDYVDAYIQKLFEAGIRHFINLVGEEENVPLEDNDSEDYKAELLGMAAELGIHDVSYERYRLTNKDVPSPKTMQAILDSIDHSLALQRPVYVHCLAGIGRTGTVAGCYLARHGIATGKDALLKLRELREDHPFAAFTSPEKASQIQMVTGWQVGQ